MCLSIVFVALLMCLSCIFRSPVNTVDETIKDIKWPKVAKMSELMYLEINSTFTVGRNYYEERVAFWDQLTMSSNVLNKDEL